MRPQKQKSAPSPKALLLNKFAKMNISIRKEVSNIMVDCCITYLRNTVKNDLEMLYATGVTDLKGQ